MFPFSDYWFIEENTSDVEHIYASGDSTLTRYCETTIGMTHYVTSTYLIDYTIVNVVCIGWPKCVVA